MAKVTAIGTMKPVSPAPRPKQCSFCGREQHETAFLLEGPVAFICDGCVVQAMAMLKQHRREAKEPRE